MPKEIQTASHADILQYPFMVSIQELQLEERHLCAGIILTMSWVLTASQCLIHPGPEGFTREELKREPAYYIILSGTQDYSYGFRAQCKIFHIHYNASMDPTNFQQGLALIGLWDDLIPSPQTKAAQYAPARKKFRTDMHGSSCKVIGWTRFGFGKVKKFQLIEFVVTVMSKKDCRSMEIEADLQHSDQYVCLEAMGDMPWLDASSAVVCSDNVVAAIVVSKFHSEDDSSVYLALRLDISALWIQPRIRHPASVIHPRENKLC